MHRDDMHEHKLPPLPPPIAGRERWMAGPYVVDVEDGIPCCIWHITSRAVTEVPCERWTDRLLDMIDRTATRV